MRVVADSHAIYWYMQQSDRLSDKALAHLADAEDTEGIAVSAITVPELWMAMSRKRRGQNAIAETGFDRVRVALQDTGTAVDVIPVDSELWQYFEEAASVLPDPFDALIVATARALKAPLVTADRAITSSGLVETIW